MLVRRSSNLRIPYSALIFLKELFQVSSVLKLLLKAFNLIIAMVFHKNKTMQRNGCPLFLDRRIFLHQEMELYARV